MADTTMTLGARIRENLAEEKAHPLDAARKKATEQGKQKEFETIERLYARFQKHIEDSVNAANFPKPLRLTQEECSALCTYQWDGNSPGPSALSLGYVLWSNFCLWAKAQELPIKWKHGHDGGGIKSWYDLCVVLPTKQ
jgi:hypothetical protein